MTILEFLFILQLLGFFACFIAQLLNISNFGKKYEYKNSFIVFILLNLCYLMSFLLMMSVDYNQSDETLIYPILNEVQTMFYYISWALWIVELLFLLGIFSMGTAHYDSRKT